MKVFCIIVSYHPHVERLAEVCRTLIASRAEIVIVDNSEVAVDIARLPTDACTLVALGRNTGIAFAQNVGIRTALAKGADVIVMFDQDSRPEGDFLRRLVAHLVPGQLGVVAPVCIDRATGRELPSFRLGRFGHRHKINSAGRSEPYPVDLVVSSGCAATAASYSAVGGMDEDFFIDFVDFEWCLRCRKHGVPINVVPNAVMQHSIGERSARFAGSIHSTARSYYKLRNPMLLFRKSHVSRLFAARATLLAMIHYAAALPLVRNKLDYAKMFVVAIHHGVRGVVGKNPLEYRATQI
jgi:rhamnosyltransferase